MGSSFACLCGLWAALCALCLSGCDGGLDPIAVQGVGRDGAFDGDLGDSAPARQELCTGFDDDGDQFVDEGACALVRGICDDNQWCWFNPTPTGESLESVWALSPSVAWAVGEYGVMMRWDGTQWDQVVVPTPQSLHDVVGFGADDVWAVGARGTALHWDGASWATSATGTTEDLLGVWGAAPNDVWAVGANGVIVRWDGARWQVSESTTTSVLADVWGASDSDVWAVGLDDTVLRWQGASWGALDTGTAEAWLGVWVSPAGQVWMVSREGAVLRWSGAFEPTPRPGSTLRSVWGVDAATVWVGGEKAYRWSGVGWTEVGLEPAVDRGEVAGVGGSSAENLWFVGSAGILHQSTDGVRAYGGRTIAEGDLNGTSATAGGDAWVVGDGGTVLHWDGEQWVRVVNDTPGRLNDVWARAPSDVWIAGDFGTVLHWDGARLTRVETGQAEHLEAIWGSAATDIWAAGTGGVIVHWDGRAWAPVASGTSEQLVDVWGTSSTDAWAVGPNGTFVRWDGTAWTVLPSDPLAIFRGVWASAPNDVWLAEAQGLWRYDGTTLALHTRTTDSLRAVGGSSAQRVFAAGRHFGELYAWDGITWRTEPWSSVVRFNAVAATPERVWAVGDNGVIVGRP